MLLQNLKWTELRDLALSSIPVIMPLGSFEQHGPHLPFTTDTDIVTGIAREIETRRHERILVAPTLWLGHSPHHLNFPGTLSVSPRVYIDVLKSLVHSMVKHGARKILLLNGHGGNEAPAPVALRELKTELATHTDLFVVFASYWSLASATLRKVRESGPGGLGHACEMETSLMLLLAPGRVDMSAARKDGPGESLRYRVVDLLATNPVQFVSEFDEMTDSGVLGDPRLASVEKGRAFFEGIVNSVLEFIEDFRSWTPDSVKGRVPGTG